MNYEVKSFYDRDLGNCISVPGPTKPDLKPNDTEHEDKVGQ